MTLRNPKTGRFVSAASYRALLQPRERNGRFARAAPPIAVREGEPQAYFPEPIPSYIPSEEPPEEFEEGEYQDYVVEVEIRGEYGG